MSLRSSFRGKLKADDKEGKTIKTPGMIQDDSDDTVVVNSTEDKYLDTTSISQELYLSKLAELTDSLNDVDGQKNWSNSEKEIFEVQLSNLQEQLVASMIENQTLSEELKKYKEKSELDQLRHELEYEKDRNKLLSDKFEELETRKSARRRVSADEEYDGVELVREADESDIRSEAEKVLQRQSGHSRLMTWLMTVYYEFISDFIDNEEEEELPRNKEGDQLSVKKLKENIKRFTTCTKPIVNFIKVVYVILCWKAPALSLLFFSVYMYSVWCHWLLSLFLGVILYCLTKNYMTAKGWHINLSLLPYHHIEEDSEGDKVLGMSDKFQLVLQVARKVQNTLGIVADSLEKLRNLFLWEHPESTRKLYATVCVAFIASIFLPGPFLFKLIGLFLGLKMFIINNIYRKFPKVKDRYDTVQKIWKELPTEAVLIKRKSIAEREQYILPASAVIASPPVQTGSSSPTTARAVLSNENQTFCHLFALPPSEAPLPDWQGGKRCTLISKEKTLTGAFKNGKLYLTRSFLCFERSKNPTPKNLVIPLTDITALEKAKPYGFLPGGGMAIDVHVTGIDKPYLFGAMMNRDEAYDSIIRAAQQACLAWAMDDDDETDRASTYAEM
ncbi:GRAM domain-containing protein 4-like isoform X2 [Glandiceps talaboti]